MRVESSCASCCDAVFMSRTQSDSTYSPNAMTRTCPGSGTPTLGSSTPGPDEWRLWSLRTRGNARQAAGSASERRDVVCKNAEPPRETVWVRKTARDPRIKLASISLARRVPVFGFGVHDPLAPSPLVTRTIAVRTLAPAKARSCRSSTSSDERSSSHSRTRASFSATRTLSGTIAMSTPARESHATADATKMAARLPERSGGSQALRHLAAPRPEKGGLRTIAVGLSGSDSILARPRNERKSHTASRHLGRRARRRRTVVESMSTPIRRAFGATAATANNRLPSPTA